MLLSPKGKAVRADYTRVEAEEPRRLVWRQEVEESPFERILSEAVTELSRYGVAGRNLRVFKTSAERESALLQQILAPALRSRNPERRKEAVEALENLAAIASHLKHLLLVRDLRKLTH